MGLFDKLKNIFIEEEEIESEESYKSIPKKIEVKEETKKEEVVKKYFTGFIRCTLPFW